MAIRSPSKLDVGDTVRLFRWRRHRSRSGLWCTEVNTAPRLLLVNVQYIRSFVETGAERGRWRLNECTIETTRSERCLPGHATLLLPASPPARPEQVRLLCGPPSIGAGGRVMTTFRGPIPMPEMLATGSGVRLGNTLSTIRQPAESTVRRQWRTVSVNGSRPWWRTRGPIRLQNVYNSKRRCTWIWRQWQNSVIWY